MEDIESIVLPDEAPMLYDEAGFPIESYKQQSEAQLGWGEDLLPPPATESEPAADSKKQPESEDDESEQIADRRMKNSQDRAEQNGHSEQPSQSQVSGIVQDISQCASRSLAHFSIDLMK